MADVLCKKLLHCPSISTRLPPLSHPFNLNNLSLSIIHFAPIKRARFSLSSLSSKLPSDSAPLDIVSTAENPDGSIVFKFADASEIPQRADSGTDSEPVETLDCSDDDVDGKKSDIIESLGGEGDSTDPESVESRTLDGENGIGDGSSEVQGAFSELGDENVALNEENAVTDESSEVKGAVDGGDDVGDVTNTFDGENKDGVKESQAQGALDGEGNDTTTTLDDKDGVVDATLEDEHGVSDIVTNLDGESGADVLESEVQGTPDGEVDGITGITSDKDGVVDVNLEGEHGVSDMVKTVDSESRGGVLGSEVQGTLDGEVEGTTCITENKDGVGDVTLEAEHGVSDMITTLDSESGVDALESKVQGTLDGDVDGIMGITDGKIESGIDDSESEVQGALNAELDVSDTTATKDGNDVYLGEAQVQETLDGENDITDAHSVIDAESFVNDAKEEVQGALYDECNISDHKPKQQGTLNGVKEVISEKETDAYLAQTDIRTDGAASEVVDGDDAEVEQSVNNEIVLEGTVESSLQMKELKSFESKKDGDSADVGTPNNGGQSSEYSADIEHSHESTLAAVVENLPSSQITEHNVDMESLITTSDSDVDFAMDNSSDSEIVNQDAKIDTPTTPDSISEDLITDTSAKVEDNEGVAVVLTSQPEFDGEKSLIVNGKNSDVEAPDVGVSVENNDAGSNLKTAINEDSDLTELNQMHGQLEVELIVDQEANSDVVDDVAAMGSSLSSNMSGDCPRSNDILEVPSTEAAGVTFVETNLDSVSCAEISRSILSLSSAHVSLPHPSEALTGGEDACFVHQNWFGVADGVGQWSFGGVNRGQYAQELIQNCTNLALSVLDTGFINIKEILQRSAAMTQSTGSARAIIGHTANEMLHVVNIGDCGFIIIRNGAVFKKSSPMFHEFNFPYAIGSGDDDSFDCIEEYHIDLQDGDVIITATDGLFDNLYEQEIASIVSKSVGVKMEPEDLAELLAVKAQEVGKSASARSPFADAAQAAGHAGFSGGKLDHVTVIVSFVQSR